ncbi:hypothetical protein [Actinopolymorpha alba]|uniref:hypothetical protein n=1 Tax=Actinopolymorpha alba TaxID=533267 RepID=UPI0012F64E3C|nr:hypothetical protein [Actinopolymorpha alba]
MTALAPLIALGLSTSATAAEPEEPTPASTKQAKYELVPAFTDDIPISGTIKPTAANPCIPYASNPELQLSSIVHGYGRQVCSGSGWPPQRITVRVQRYLGLDLWQNVNTPSDSGYTGQSTIEETTDYLCRSTGDERYRIVTDGYWASGYYHAAAQSPLAMRWTC